MPKVKVLVNSKAKIQTYVCFTKGLKSLVFEIIIHLFIILLGIYFVESIAQSPRKIVWRKWQSNMMLFVCVCVYTHIYFKDLFIFKR